MSGRGRKGAAEVFMFLKQSKEMKIPFCLSSSDRRGRGRKALKEKKHKKKGKKEKKIVFLSVDKAGTGIIIMYKYGKEGGGERGGDETGFVFAFQSKQARRRVPTIGGVVGG